MNLEKVLLQARTHLGHHKTLTNPSMKEYIYGRRRGREIFDVRQTAFHLKLARKVIQEVYNREGLILVHLNSDFEAQLLFPLLPKLPRLLVLRGSWVGGLFTNWEQMQKYPLHIEESSFNSMPTAKKKGIKRKFAPFVDLLENKTFPFSENKCLPRPDLFVTFKAKNAKTSLEEAWKAKIPTVSIIDTDADPQKITYGIPGNDENGKALYIYTQILFSTLNKTNLT